MGRIRTIKPEFPQSESMGRVSRDARLLFIQLWTLCDDEGRTRADSRMIARLLYPYDDGDDGHFKTSTKDVDKWFAELEREQCVFRYQAEGTTYAQIAKWLNHQKIDRPSKSKIPPFDECSRQFAMDLEDSTTDQGSKDQGSRKGREGKGEDKAPADADAELFPGVDPQVIADFKSIRKQKKAAITLTAMQGIQREAEKAGMSLDDALRVCCVRGWQGFKAEWITRDQSVGARNGMPAQKQSNMEATLAAAERARKMIFGDDGEGSNAAG